MSFQDRPRIFAEWLKTEAGQEYQKANKEHSSWAIPKLDPVPDGWSISDGSEDPKAMDFGYFCYQSDDGELEYSIQSTFKVWLPMGGYPKSNTIEIIEVYPTNRVVAEFSIFKLGFEEALKQAQEKLRRLMS